jgi:glycosyltransferase involved in cell wall biosynthesis
MKLSMVTYTYNDGGLVRDLLKSVSGWSVTPEDFLVVDDGSAEPFETDGPARVVRLEKNRGPAEAKRFGISSCSGDVILSMDCDVRPDPAWLETALPKALDPGIGLAGAPVLAAGDDPVSRYARKFGVHAPGNGKVGLVSGEIWLMRSEIWKRAGGFGDFTGTTHEDFFFSRRVANLGLELILVESPPVRGVRRLSREDYVRRHISYSSRLSADYLRRAGRSGLTPLVRATASRLAELRAENEAGLAYIELYKFSAFVLSMLEAGLRFEGTPEQERAAFIAGLGIALGGHPETFELLAADLRSLGLDLPGAAENPAGAYWSSAFGALASTGALDAIERNGLQEVTDDAHGRRYDFHYLRSAGQGFS